MLPKQPPDLTALEHKLKQQARQEQASIVTRKVRTCVGASTWRALANNTKLDVTPILQTVDLNRFRACNTETEYRRFFCDELSRVDRAVRRKNSKVQGRKWGYSAKILCLFLRGMVLHTRYFDDKNMARLKRFLYVPVDRIVLKEIRKMGLNPGSRAIKTMTKDTFWSIQKWLIEAASNVKVSPVIFDDVWSDRD